jgi:cell division septum initiation protein DivIVA
MSIATTITGGSASSQLMDLLTVMADPNAYKAKLDALETATAENKKYVEALGPASEIVDLRDQAKALREEADAYKTTTTAEADAVLAAAKDQAALVVADAKAQADQLTSAAKVKADAADALMGKALGAQAQVDVAVAAATAAQADYEAKAADLNARVTAAATAQAEAEAYRDSLAAKAQAFAKGL